MLYYTILYYTRPYYTVLYYTQVGPGGHLIRTGAYQAAERCAAALGALHEYFPPTVAIGSG